MTLNSLMDLEPLYKRDFTFATSLIQFIGLSYSSLSLHPERSEGGSIEFSLWICGENGVISRVRLSPLFPSVPVELGG